MKKFILTAYISVLFLILLNTTLTSAQNNNVAVTPVPTITPVQSDNEQIAVLKAQVELMKEYHERILDTVYWSLGALGGVIFIVLGLGWYNNKRNVDGLKQDIKTSLHKELLTELRESAKVEIEKIKSNEFRNIEEMKLGLQKMKFNLMELEVKQWKAKEVYSNQLSTALDLIKVAIEMKSEYNILRSLEYIKEAVKLGNVGDEGHRTEYIDLLETLDSLPEKFNIDVESIRNIIKAKRSQ